MNSAATAAKLVDLCFRTARAVCCVQTSGESGLKPPDARVRRSRDRATLKTCWFISYHGAKVRLDEGGEISRAHVRAKGKS